MSTPDEVARITDAWSEFLERWPWDWFVTLTFRREIHPEAAAKLFHVWISKMNRSLHGPRWRKHGQGVRWARALEMQRREVIHYHALIGGPNVRKLKRLTWMDVWQHLDDHRESSGFAPRPGFARIQPPRDDGAVRGYVAKYVAKGGELDLGGPEIDGRAPVVLLPAGRPWRPSAPWWGETVA